MSGVIHLPMDDYEIVRQPDGTERHVCTMRQIVRHTIGLDVKRPYTRYGVRYYRPYRNYFNTTVGSHPWPILEEHGYAVHGEEWERRGRRMTDYYLTEKGLAWVGAELNIVIRRGKL